MATKTARKRRAYRGPACPRCNRPLPGGETGSGMQTCPFCRGVFEAERFAPPETRVVVPQVSESGPGGAASCAYHARNAAVATCERCGSFICALCRMDVEGKVYCPACFERLTSELALPGAITKFRDYGLVAQSWAASGLFFAPLGLLAVGYGVKALKQKRKESRGVAGTYVCIALGALESVGFVFLLVGLAMALFGGLD